MVEIIYSNSKVVHVDSIHLLEEEKELMPNACRENTHTHIKKHHLERFQLEIVKPQSLSPGIHLPRSMGLMLRVQKPTSSWTGYSETHSLRSKRLSSEEGPVIGILDQLFEN